MGKEIGIYGHSGQSHRITDWLKQQPGTEIVHQKGTFIMEMDMMLGIMYSGMKQF